jgi:hypothetical protein
MFFVALVVLSATLPNDSDAADNITWRTPVPPNRVCKELEPSPPTVSVPVRDPVTVGMKMTEIVQLELPASVFGDNGQGSSAAIRARTQKKT